MQYLTTAAAMFCYVFLRVIQQRNVVMDKYYAAIPTSYAMVGVDMFVVSLIAREGWNLPLWLALGTGAALASVFAMYLHKKIWK